MQQLFHPTKKHTEVPQLFHVNQFKGGKKKTTTPKVFFFEIPPCPSTFLFVCFFFTLLTLFSAFLVSNFSSC